jgi:hypothetical protein
MLWDPEAAHQRGGTGAEFGAGTGGLRGGRQQDAAETDNNARQQARVTFCFSYFSRSAQEGVQLKKRGL